MMYHVIFLARAPLEDFLSGLKCVELRLAENFCPWMLTRVGDHALLKRNGGIIEAIGYVVAVDLVHRGGDLDAFRRRWWSGRAEDQYLFSKEAARYAAAVELDGVHRVEFPAERTPRGVRMGWIADFDVGDWRETT